MRKDILYYIIPAFIIGAALGTELFHPPYCEGLLENLWANIRNLLLLLPPVFILIGLFEVWVKKETIEKHLGASHGFSAWFWLILLSATTIGGLYVSLPLAYALHNKGMRMRLVYAFLGFSTVCRIPMTFFEASFLGLKFTLLRYCIALPLIIISSVFLERIIVNKPA